MKDSITLIVLLPLALGIIMLGLGLSLWRLDFKRALRKPKALIIALICQTVALPLICLGLVCLFKMDPALAVGMMLLAASPGGPSANLYSHLANGDVALNITLTAINSALSVVTLPLIVNASLKAFMPDSQGIALQFDKVFHVFLIVLVPVLIGMGLRSRFPAFANAMNRPVKWLSTLFLGTGDSGRRQEWGMLLKWGPIAGLATLAFNLASMLLGYVAPRAAGVNRPQATAISMKSVSTTAHWPSPLPSAQPC